MRFKMFKKWFYRYRGRIYISDFNKLSVNRLHREHVFSKNAFYKSKEFRSVFQNKLENFNYYKSSWKLRKHSILYILLCIFPFFFCFLFIILFLSFCDFFELNNWLVWIIFVFLVLLCSFCSVKIKEYKDKKNYFKN